MSDATTTNTTARSMDHSGCLRCGETREDQRHSPCQGRRYQSHDWYVLEFAICRQRPGARDDGFGLSQCLALRGRVPEYRRDPWPREYGWSGSHAYASRFRSVEQARACITALGLVDVDIRRCEFPTSTDHLPVVWPQEAVQAGIDRIAAHERAVAEMRAAAATRPCEPSIGDSDRWLGDEVGRALVGEFD